MSTAAGGVPTELARRGWPAWAWATGRQEEFITEQIRCRIDPGQDPVLARMLVEALLDGVRPDDRERLAAIPLWGYELGPRLGPDLLLVDRGDRVHAVIEHKIFAAANAGLYAHFEQGPRLTDPVACSLPPRPGTDGTAPRAPWIGSREGARLSQIDYYRCSRSWLHAPLSLDDASSALWILLDHTGRPAATAFPYAHTAGVWQTTGYAGFVQRLQAAYDQAAAGGNAHRCEQLKDLIRMCLS